MIRASDRDREAVAETLREACAAGRLTLPEFTERMEQAFTSKTLGELRALTRDLPEQPRLGADLPALGVVPHLNPDPDPSQPPAGSPVRSQVRSPARGRARNVPRRRSRGWGTPVPFVLAWLLIVLVTRSASVAVPVVVVALVLLFTALSRRS
jgi:hypothetical protein